MPAGADGLCSAAAAAASGLEGDGVYVVGVDGPDPDSPSATGCTTFSPAISGLSFDARPSSSSLAGEDDGSGAPRYGAVFRGQFSGMTDLSGSVSLHVSFDDPGVLESLPDPATVDLALEACTAGPTVAGGGGGGGGAVAPVLEYEWDTCEEGWQAVLFQVGVGVGDLLFSIGISCSL